MKYFGLTIYIFFYFFNSVCFHQDSISVSLQYPVDSFGEDTIKVNELNVLSFQKVGYNPNEAIQLALEAKALAEQINFRKGEAIALNNLRLAIEYRIPIITITEGIGYKGATADDLNNLKIAFRAWDSIPLYNKSVAANKDHLWPSILNNLAMVYVEKEEYNNALINFDQAYQIAKNQDSKYEMILALLGKAEICQKMKNVKSAQKYYKEAETIGLLIDANNELKVAYEGLSDTYTIMQDYRNALKYQALLTELNLIIQYSDNKNGLKRLQFLYEIDKDQGGIDLKSNYFDTIVAYSNRRDSTFKDEITSLAKKWTELGDAQQKSIQNTKTQRNLIIIALIFALGIILLTYLAYKNNRKKKELLFEQNQLILEHKQEIEGQRDKLSKTLNDLKRIQNQLIQSEKLASLGGLVAGVAHEINTPVGIGVTAVSSLIEETKNMADLYNREQISRKDFKEFLQTTNDSARLVQKNLERTAELVQSFKQVSVDQSTEEQRKFFLKAYLEDVIRSLYPKFKNRDIQVNIECDDKLEIRSYPGVFAQIFTNLLLNSIAHGFLDGVGGQVEIHVSHDNNELSINYMDNGKGIPEDILPKIFDPFFTTDQSKGTGLGLNIVYNLVTQKLNGTIVCESIIKNGVEFKIKIPISG